MKPMDAALLINLEHFVHGSLAEHHVERRYDKTVVAHFVEVGEALAFKYRFGTKAFDRAMTREIERLA